MRRKRQTAAELMAQLNADPTFVARQRERQQTREQDEHQFRVAQAPLLEALHKAGVPVRSVVELASITSLAGVVHLLTKHLERPYPPKVREWIARALARPESASQWRVLKRIFESEMDTTTSGVKWALGCALAAAATDDVVEDLAQLIGERRHGRNRLSLVSGLSKSADPRAREALAAVASDPDLAGEVDRVLKRNGTKQVGSVGHATGRDVGDLSEVSFNCDAEDVEPLLARIAELVEGFGPDEIAQITALPSHLDVDSEAQRTFQVSYKGHRVPLRVAFFMDDVESPDLTLFTAAPLAAAIDECVSAYFEERES